jgi:hypothetical protein
MKMREGSVLERWKERVELLAGLTRWAKPSLISKVPWELARSSRSSKGKKERH